MDGIEQPERVGAEIVTTATTAAVAYQPPAMSTVNAVLAECEILSRTSLVPKDYRDYPENIYLAWAEGRKFGWDIMTSLASIHVIGGKATLSANAQLGVIRRAGHPVSIDSQRDYCTVVGTRADTGETHETTFDIQDAEDAELTTGRNKDTWRKYRRAMLRSRAVSELGRCLFSDVLLGMWYTPDELGADVAYNDDGDPVMVTPPPSRSGGNATALPRSATEARGRAKTEILATAGGNVDNALAAWRAVVDDPNTEDLAQITAAPRKAKVWLRANTEPFEVTEEETPERPVELVTVFGPDAAYDLVLRDCGFDTDLAARVWGDTPTDRDLPAERVAELRSLARRTYEESLADEVTEQGTLQ